MKTKHIVFHGIIDHETIVPVLDAIDSAAEQIMISMNSAGGSLQISRFLLYVLNSNKDRVTLCATTGVYSSAFDVFYGFKGKRLMTQKTMGMFHFSYRNVNIDCRGEIVDSKDRASMEDNSWRKDIRFAAPFMTDKEMRKLKSGKDVYFSSKRMKEIFPDVEVI